MDVEKRILQERENWRKERPFGFVAKPRVTENKTLNLHFWDCSIPGPEGSAFEGLDVKLAVEFYKTYPVSPPGVRFVSEVYHPNVYTDGAVCLDVLSTAWRSSMNIKTVLIALHDLLLRPNVGSPANEGAASLYAADRAKYTKVALDVFHGKKLRRTPKPPRPSK